MSNIALACWIDPGSPNSMQTGYKAGIVKDDGPWSYSVITSANTSDWALLQAWITAGHSPDPITDPTYLLPK